MGARLAQATRWLRISAPGAPEAISLLLGMATQQRQRANGFLGTLSDTFDRRAHRHGGRSCTGSSGESFR